MSDSLADADVAVARTPRAILAHFTTHQATEPHRAMGFNPTQPGEIVLFERLRAEGVIREASPKLFYVNEGKLAARQGEAAMRVAGVSAVAGLLIIGFSLLRRRRTAA